MAVLQDININVHGQPSEKRLQTFLRLSQNENGRLISFRVLGPPLPSNCTATFSGTKPDGNVYSKTGTVTGNFVIIEEDIQMTAVAGVWDAKLDIINGTHNIMTALIRVVVDADVVDPDAIASDSQLQGLVAEAKYYAEHARTDAYGSPLTAALKAEMTDKTRVYVYTGSETGMTAGNWYYWNSSAWTSGGVYNAVAVQTDTTLRVAGKPADGKAAGDAVASLKEDLSKLTPGLSDEAKTALLNCFQHVAWIDAQGQTYYDALETALYEVEEKTLVSISAVFNQGSAVIYADSALSDLKPYLTVTARYSDGTTQTVTSYTLSGTLTTGTSTITASYSEKTATFNVTVSPVETPKRYIVQGDIASHIGIPSINVSNGTISETSPTTFSCVVFDQSIEKMWFNLHTHLDSRRRPRYIFRKDADGSFYAIDESTTSPKLYKFTLDTGGTKYNATQISDISSVTTFTKTGDYFSTLKKEMNISNGILTITDADSSVSFTNANCFGYWQAAYNSNISAGMFDECEVEADE